MHGDPVNEVGMRIVERLKSGFPMEHERAADLVIDYFEVVRGEQRTRLLRKMRGLRQRLTNSGRAGHEAPAAACSTCNDFISLVGRE